MKNIFYLLILIGLLGGCTKNNDFELASPQRKIAFDSQEDAFKKTQQILNTFKDKETISKIDKIQYFDSKDKSFAFIYYYTETGYTNIAIEKDYVLSSDGTTYKESQISSVKCTNYCGPNRCLVEAHFDEHNNCTYADCTCSSCKMEVVVSQVALSTFEP